MILGPCEMCGGQVEERRGVWVQEVYWTQTGSSRKKKVGRTGKVAHTTCLEGDVRAQEALFR